MRILIDTDIGGDIDDALALALALRLPDVNIIGVTSVWGDTHARALMARHLLNLFGAGDVPVYAGVGKPLLGPLPRDLHQPQLNLTPTEITSPASGHAVDFIRNAYAEPGSDVTLVTLGPLTNLALALAIEPALAERIPHVVVMGGQVGLPEPDTWNFLCDVEAAAIVFRAGLRLTLVPLDVTLQTQMRAEHLEALKHCDDERVRWLLTLLQVWQEHENHLPILHDPLAIAVAVDPTVVRMQRMSLDLITETGPERGRVQGREGASTVEVAMEVDGPRFVDWFTERLVG